MTVWITQCVCPARHCIAASFGEAEDQGVAVREIKRPLISAVRVALQAREINPWCGLCEATHETWDYELKRTRFQTMEEAKPEMERMAAEQAITRSAWASKQGTRH